MIGIYLRIFRSSHLASGTLSLRCLFQTCSKRQSLFDPFKPKVSSGKSIFDKVPSSFKLIYVTSNQRLTHFALSALCLTGLIAIPFPIAALILELTGLSKFSEIEPNYVPIVIFCSFHFLLVASLSLKVKNSMVFRIYADESNKNYAMITFGRVFSLNVEQFSKNSVKYRVASPDLSPSKKIFYQITSRINGNFLINGKSRVIESKNFVNEVAFRRFIGDEVFDSLKSKKIYV